MTPARRISPPTGPSGQSHDGHPAGVARRSPRSTGPAAPLHPEAAARAGPRSVPETRPTDAGPPGGSSTRARRMPPPHPGPRRAHSAGPHHQDATAHVDPPRHRRRTAAPPHSRVAAQPHRRTAAQPHSRTAALPAAVLPGRAGEPSGRALLPCRAVPCRAALPAALRCCCRCRCRCRHDDTRPPDAPRSRCKAAGELTLHDGARTESIHWPEEALRTPEPPTERPAGSPSTEVPERRPTEVSARPEIISPQSRAHPGPTGPGRVTPARGRPSSRRSAGGPPPSRTRRRSGPCADPSRPSPGCRRCRRAGRRTR